MAGKGWCPAEPVSTFDAETPEENGKLPQSLNKSG